MKKCNKCGVEKDLIEFHAHKTTKDKLRPNCKKCRSSSSKEYYKNTKEKTLLRAAKYRSGHKEEATKYSKEYYLSHKEKFSQYGKRWYEDNREEVLVQTKQYREGHKDEIAVYMKQYQEDHKEERKHYREEHKEDISEYNKKWFKNNPEKPTVYRNNRRARKVGNGGEHTAQEWFELKERYDHACLCCNRKEPEIKLTADHIIPISKGGTSNIENMQPLCKSCNSSKRDKTIDYRKKE